MLPRPKASPSALPYKQQSIRSNLLSESTDLCVGRSELALIIYKKHATTHLSRPSIHQSPGAEEVVVVVVVVVVGAFPRSNANNSLTFF